MTVYILFGVIAYLVLSIVLNNREYRKQLQAQQDTIQKLLNREPVTYQETGQKQPKIIEEVYSAWGNVTIDREAEDDSRG